MFKLPLNSKIAVVNADGTPSGQFQRFWQKSLQDVSDNAAAAAAAAVAAAEAQAVADGKLDQTAADARYIRITDATRFGSNANGFWEKRANGVIEQWGNAAYTSTGVLTEQDVTVTLPIAFPTSIDGIGGLTEGHDTGGARPLVLIYKSKTLSTITFTLIITGGAGNIPVSGNFYWRAIGR